MRDACAVLVLSSILALVTTVLIEAPIVAVQNRIAGKARVKKEEESETVKLKPIQAVTVHL